MSQAARKRRTVEMNQSRLCQNTEEEFEVVKLQNQAKEEDCREEERKRVRIQETGGKEGQIWRIDQRKEEDTEEMAQVKRDDLSWWAAVWEEVPPFFKLLLYGRK